MIKQISTAVNNLTNNYEKSILTDKFNRFHNYLRISITERCNLRCSYCMPEQGLDLTNKDELLSMSEYNRLIDLFCKLGVTKVRLTGGEPLVNNNCVSIINEISKYTKNIGITTNGLVLKNKIKDLKEAGMSSVNISLDTLIEAKFNFITKRQGLNKVTESIFLAQDLYKSEFELNKKLFDSINYNKALHYNVKVNCVVIKNFNHDEIINMIEYLTKDFYIDLRFIEFMPFADNSKNSLYSI